MSEKQYIKVVGAREHNLKNVSVDIPRGKITVVTGVSGSGKSSLAFDTVLAECQRRFFYTLSHYSRQFLDMGQRPKVNKIEGLSPAIALAQNETQASVRATVASLTDIGELLGVLLAKHSTKYCPHHDLPTEVKKPEILLEDILGKYKSKMLAFCIPYVRQKKGAFRKLLEDLALKGYTKVIIDGKLTDLEPMPKLNASEKHDLFLVVDIIKADEKKSSRIADAIKRCLKEGEGEGFYVEVKSGLKFDLKNQITFTSEGGCPQCGFAWPKLDSRYFSPNSLGRCTTCNGLGFFELDEEDEDSDWTQEPCSDCKGTGLSSQLSGLKLNKRDTHDIYLMGLASFNDFLKEFKGSTQNKAALRIVEELEQQAERILGVGLSYIHLSRRIRSLSPGESQRLKLANILGENLRGVLYVLDEPSQGLHEKEIEGIWKIIERLKALGNTIIIVDHDEWIINKADLILDLGPDGGRNGGQLLAQYTPKDAKKFVHKSLTAKYLAEFQETKLTKVKKKVAKDSIVIHEPRLFNLSMNKVHFPIGKLSVVSGVSGAGKSSLVLSTLFENMIRYLDSSSAKSFKPRFCKKIDGFETFEQAILVDRRPVAKSSVSMPATYLDVFTDLRNFYAKLPEAQIFGVNARDFSLSVEGGRCPECKGKGQLSLSMKFLSDAKVRCPSCHGKRYKASILDVTYNGKSLADVLDMTLNEVSEHFQTFSKIVRKLKPAIDLGLGYLHLGQPSSSLSGGESQRLKVSQLLQKKWGAGSLVVLDEPTTGLHFRDVTKLLDQVNLLVSKGATVVLIEHNSSALELADWVVELGPGSADQGGKLCFEGGIRVSH